VLFNRSWQTGETPLAWREANICPLPKEDYPSRASEFRPIFDNACQMWNDASESSKHSLIDCLQHKVLGRAMGVRRGTSAHANGVPDQRPYLNTEVNL